MLNYTNYTTIVKVKLDLRGRYQNKNYDSLEGKCWLHLNYIIYIILISVTGATTYRKPRTCVSASKTEVIEDGYKSSFTEDPRQQMSMKFTYFNILPPHFSL